VKSPVTQEVRPGDNEKKILVPETNRQVWFLAPAATKMPLKLTQTRKLASANELVVIYQYKGRYFYRTVKAFTAIEAVQRV
jgi:hypothetical protein